MKQEQKQLPVEKAYSIFEKRAAAENRNYFGDMVKDNLSRLVSNGYTPDQAVNALFNQANGGRRVV